VQGQSFPTFDQVDYVTVQDFSIFEAIWEKAETENVRIALFGDSQETSPAGAGAIYIPSLNFEFYQHFGKVGESFVSPGFSSFGGGSPAAEWLLQGSPGSFGHTFAGTLRSTQLLPGTTSRIITSSAFGMSTMLDTTNVNLSGNGVLGQDGPLWHPNDEIVATVFGVTREGSDEFSWRASPTNESSGSHFRPNSATGTTSIGLDGPSGQILSQEVGPLPFNGLARQQLIVRGTGSNGAELAGVRFQNLSTPGGISIQDFSAGGYTTRSFRANHQAAGKMLTAFGVWDAILLHTGANDAYSFRSSSAVNFQRDVSEFIDMIRGPDWLDNPNQKFILVTDPYRNEGAASINFQFDQYAGALAELALNDPNVMAVNSRRLAEQLGWNENDPERFLTDIVHYNANGAIALAAIESQLMLNGGLVGDFNVDRNVDVADIDRYSEQIGTPASGESTLLDFDADGIISANDLQIHIETYVQTSNGAVGTFLGDLNLDGSVDVLGDVFVLIGNLNGSATSYGQGDFNLDGTVNVLGDVFVLIGNLGNTNTP